MQGHTILIVTERFHPEEFRINELALEWKKRGFAVKVLTQFPSYPNGKLFEGYSNRLHQKEDWNGIEIHRVYSVMGYTDSVVKKILNYATHAFLGSVVAPSILRGVGSIFVYHTGPLSNVIPAIVAKKICRKKIAIWTTDIWPDAVFAYGFKKSPRKERLLNAFVRWVFGNCDQILVTSRRFIAKLQPYAPGKEIHYIPYWADAAICEGNGSSPAIALSARKRCHFTFVGNIGKLQNLENVIRGFALARNSTEMQLNIIGYGSDVERLKRLVDSEGIGNVVFWGRRSAATEMPAFYRQSDVMVISLKNVPHNELMVPCKLQTYLCTGKPIFAILRGEVKDMVEEQTLGVTADPDNLEEIAHGFERLYSIGEEERENYGRHCLQFLEREFNEKLLMNRITMLLDFTPFSNDGATKP